ncbi:MAG: oligosaccharide flippase family protein [Pseudomonadota bacterium]
MNISDNHLKNEVNSIWKNSIVYMAGRALSQAVGFFMIPIYTKYIIPQNYGVLSLIEIMTSILLMIVACGVADSMPRFYYQEKVATKRNEIISTIILGLGTSGILLVIVALVFSNEIAAFLFEKTTYYLYFKVAILTVWFGLVNEIAFTYLRLLYRAKLFVVMTLFQLCISLSLNIWFIVYLKWDILGIFASTLIAQGFITTVLLIIIFKNVGFSFSFPIFKRLLSFGIPLIPNRVGLFLGFVSNRLFLRWFGAADPATALAMIGVFSLGNKFGNILDRLLNAPFNSFWGPRRMELLTSGDSNQSYVLARICTYSTIISVFASLAICAGIDDLIRIMAPPEYHKASSIVPYIVISYFFLSLERHFNIGILFKKKNIWFTYTSFFSLAIILAWNYFLIPEFGLFGAATSNMVGLAVRAILIYFISQRFFHIPYEIFRLCQLIAIAVAIYFATGFIQFPALWTSLLLKLGLVAFYPLFLMLFGFFTKKELLFLKESFVKCKKKISLNC